MVVNRKIKIDNEEIFYFLEDNNRPKVLFLHGFNSSHNFTFQLRQNKKRKYDIVAFDFPACGKSSNNQKISVENYQKIAVNFIKTLDLKVKIVVAHSLGAAIGLHILKENLAEKAILAGPLNPFIFDSSFKKQMERLGFWLLPRNLYEAKETVTNLFYKDKPNSEASLFKSAIAFFKLVEEKKELFSDMVFDQILNLDWHKNVLLPLYEQKNEYFLIGAEMDKFVPLRSVEKVGATFGKKVVKFEKTGHAIFYEKSDLINAEIEKIL
ncbi:alpha/beta hydrolase [Mesomycoplasma hyopneumoniae]|uniref:alpha/beta hydrolase n=1 Tax=Mesomycoplasma hyopneumoniae TaxID=2099 RepID=UPI0032AF5815